MNPAASKSTPHRQICTTALCESTAVALVSWRAQPQGLPFCASCAERLASHGDTVRPLAAGDFPVVADRVA